MTIRKTRLLAMSAALILSGTLYAEGVRTPSMLANTCAGCHGTLGASAGDLMPIIGGMEKEFLQTILLEYKTGERDSTIMGRLAKGYSDAELKAIASFMADQEWVSSPVKTNSKMVAMGKKIHDKQCKTCHEDNGRVQEQASLRSRDAFWDIRVPQKHSTFDSLLCPDRPAYVTIPYCTNAASCWCTTPS
ncbi:MAG: c-type cytochrome [Candidatus Thiodiazotropha sp. L084R]